VEVKRHDLRERGPREQLEPLRVEDEQLADLPLGIECDHEQDAVILGVAGGCSKPCGSEKSGPEESRSLRRVPRWLQERQCGCALCDTPDMTARLLLLVLTFAGSCGHAADRAGLPDRDPRRALRTHRHGVVVNHWLASNYDAVHSYGGAWFDREDVAWIARHGFDHIRLRASAKDWLRPDGTLDPEKLAPLDGLLAWTAAENLGLTVALTAFPVGSFTGETAIELGDDAVAGSAATVWRLVARRYAAAGDNLRFELVHSPNARTPAGLAAFNRRALAAIREVAPRRFVYLTINKMSFDAVAQATLPDEHTGLALQYFEPEAFTFPDDDSKPHVAFPGEGPRMTAAAIDGDFAKLASWAAQHASGHELYIAQFGVYHTADAASQRAYLGAMRAALERHGLSWAIYDYESGCAMRGADGTPTVAYEAIGLGPAAREDRFAVVELGKTTGTATLRRDGPDLGMRYPIDDKRSRTVAVVVDDDGMPARYDGRAAGGDGEPAIDETFRRTPASGAPAFYVPVQDDPFTPALVARWLVEHPGARLPLEPHGEATGELLGELDVDGQRVTQVAIVGLDLDPIVVWLDADRRLIAVLHDSSGYIAERHAAHLATLAAAQNAALARRAEAIAARLLHRPARGLLVRHARVFDPAALTVAPGRSILILGDRITAVGADGTITAPPGVEEIDAGGRFVMAGLWDSHAHLFGRARAMMQLAAGVTTVREMGNERDLPAQLRRYDAGLELGPRATMAMRFGFAWATTMPQVTTEGQAHDIVETAARRGYAQIKVLDDIDPKLVPLLARLAHARGMRFSGHLPSKMTLREFLEAGADELQHIPSLFRGQPREARAFDGEIQGRVELMARRRATLDPTLAQFELADGSSGLSTVELDLMTRLPPLAARRVQRDAVAPANQDRVRRGFAAFRQAVRAAIDARMTVVPGTDALLPGFVLRRELELYVELGVPPARVLRMATLDAARNMKRDAHTGSIAPGKAADVILIDGDPTRDIRDLRKVDLVIKNGWTLSPPALLESIGIRLPASSG
jgi:hypothetical protein